MLIYILIIFICFFFRRFVISCGSWQALSLPLFLDPLHLFLELFSLVHLFTHLFPHFAEVAVAARLVYLEELSDDLAPKLDLVQYIEEGVAHFVGCP